MPDYQELFEKLPDGITLHDPEGGSLLEANEQFAEMLGYSREEVLELEFEDILLDEPPYTLERAEKYIRKAATDGPQTFEWRDETKAGESLPVEVHLRQTTLDGRQRILAVVRDVTDRKERQRELERKNERLEEFASVVSHDLRNPLAVAQGRLELHREECDGDDLDGIARAHERMESLIDDLLELARAGETTMELEAVALADVVAGCWQHVETGDATLHIDATHTIRADRSRLQQLLENLVRNAVEHGSTSPGSPPARQDAVEHGSTSPPSTSSREDAAEHGSTSPDSASPHQDAVELGDPDVTVRAGDLPDGFYVEDDGTGIPEELRERVFEAGYTTGEDGTGHGLHIAKEVCAAHGWEITATDGDDGGARFEITGVELGE